MARCLCLVAVGKPEVTGQRLEPHDFIGLQGGVTKGCTELLNFVQLQLLACFVRLLRRQRNSGLVLLNPPPLLRTALHSRGFPYVKLGGEEVADCAAVALAGAPLLGHDNLGMSHSVRISTRDTAARTSSGRQMLAP